MMIDEFLQEFKVQKDIGIALKMLEQFNSKEFFKELFLLLNFEQFAKELDKEFFYSFIFFLSQKDDELKREFFYKVFIHFGLVSDSSNIYINYKDIVQFLAKSKNKILKESFKEDEKEAYFTIMIDDKSYSFKGKSIKTLRKKAYKKVFEDIL